MGSKPPRRVLDPTRVEGVQLTSWTADDGTITNYTTCMTNDSPTECFVVGSDEDAVRMYFPWDVENLQAGDEISFYQTTISNKMNESTTDWALLPYPSSQSVTTAGQITFTGTATGTRTITLTQAFIDELGSNVENDGFDGFYVRLVQANGSNGQAGVADSSGVFSVTKNSTLKMGTGT